MWEQRKTSPCINVPIITFGSLLLFYSIFFFSKHFLAFFFCVFKSVADRISSENKELLAEKGKMEWLLHELIKKLCIHVQGQHLFSLRLSLLK